MELAVVLKCVILRLSVQLVPVVGLVILLRLVVPAVNSGIFRSLRCSSSSANARLAARTALIDITAPSAMDSLDISSTL